MSKEQYVTFEVAKLLKEKGFDWKCNHYYMEKISGDEHYLLPGSIMFNENYNERIKLNELEVNINTSSGKISAPTQAMACRWLREEHSLFIEIMCGEEDGNIWYDYDILPVGENIPLIPENDGVITYEEPEEAIEAALEHVLKNLI